MNGSRAISGSVAMTLRNVVIAASESSIPSSMLTSRMFAPPRTCSSAIAAASPNWPLVTMRANRFEPVTLVRSPIMMKFAVGADGQRFEAGELGEAARCRRSSPPGSRLTRTAAAADRRWPRDRRGCDPASSRSIRRGC